MPWRLIGFIILFGILLAFTALNLDNRCNINFGFREFQEVPVFFTAFASFAAGLICALPFVLAFRGKKKVPAAKPEKKRGKKPEIPEPLPPEAGNPYGIDQ
jgi:uncharacterized integral membrane protein